MNTTDQGQQWIFGKSEIILKHDSVCLLFLKGKSQKDIRDAKNEKKIYGWAPEITQRKKDAFTHQVFKH